MGEIVNLRRARKARDRDEKAAQAAQNRRLSGLSKSERKTVEQRREAIDRTLEGARLVREPD